MKENIEERAKDAAIYIIENKATVRTAAKYLGVSKSTIHKDIRCRLPLISPKLYRECSKILDTNKRERHMRGGLATREKYKKVKADF